MPEALQYRGRLEGGNSALKTSECDLYFGMHATGTTNRGVEAKEFDIADTIDENCNSQCDSAARASSAHSHTVDETNSYIQVVVQKHRRGRGARLPAASSPAAKPHSRNFRLDTERREDGSGEGSGLGEALLMLRSQPLLLLPPLALAAAKAPPAHPARHNTNHVRNEFPGNERGDTGAGGGHSPTPAPRAELRPQKKDKSAWRLFHLEEDNLDASDGPDRFEVYYFESADVAHLATGGGARRTAVERAARRASQRAAALLDELLAAARLALAAPVAVLLAVLRCFLELQRGAVSGLVQTWSDHALKPALALLYNALLRPPLVLARAVLRAASGALGDALEPLARVLGALRLVHVHVERAPCRCKCQNSAHDTNV